MNFWYQGQGQNSTVWKWPWKVTLNMTLAVTLNLDCDLEFWPWPLTVTSDKDSWVKIENYDSLNHLIILTDKSSIWHHPENHICQRPSAEKRSSFYLGLTLVIWKVKIFQIDHLKIFPQFNLHAPLIKTESNIRQNSINKTCRRIK